MAALTYRLPYRAVELGHSARWPYKPNGKIIVGANNFGTTSNHNYGLARLNADGSEDTSFHLQVCPGISQANASRIVLQPDGKIVAVGAFSIDGRCDTLSEDRIARFNPEGTVDSTFTDPFPKIASNSPATGVALQPDGRIIFLGTLDSTVDTLKVLARLNPDGSLDSSFNIGTLQDVGFGAGFGTALTVELQSTGKILVGGDYHIFDNVASEGIVRLNADGTRDSTFESNGPGQNTEVMALIRQPDDKLLVGFVSGGGPIGLGKLNATHLNGIGRLNADGTTDTTFTPPFTPFSNVQAMALQPDGRLVLGGSMFNGSLNSIALARLNANGTLDTSFTPPDFITGLAVALQPDGKIITTGTFSLNGIVRLNANGSLDTTYNVSFNQTVSTFLIQPDGKLLVGGLFDGIGGVARNNIARLNENGSVDTSFDPGTGPDNTNGNTVRAMILQPDGKIIIGGNFLHYNGTSRPGIARLNANGSLDTSFVPVNPNLAQPTQGIGALALQPDGKIVVGPALVETLSAPFRVFRLNADGSLDDTFPLRSGLECDSCVVHAIQIQSSGQIVFGGEFDVVNGQPHLALARLLGPTPATPTPTPTPGPTPTPTPTPTPGVTTIHFSTPNFVAVEDDEVARILVTRTGDVTGTSSVDFGTVDDPAAARCDDTVNSHGRAYARCDYASTAETLTFAPNESQKFVEVPLTDDSFFEGAESLSLRLSNPHGATLDAPADATLLILDNDITPGPNPIDEAAFFVRQHYLDFLSRQPDQSGLDFWIGAITSCNADVACTEVRRINVSAAFFLSIEFQQTGYLVERMYKVAYGDAAGASTFGGQHQLAVPIVRFNEFLADAQRIGRGVIVLQPGWEQALENNKQAYANEFVQTSRFTTALPTTLTPTQFLNQLNQNAGNVLSQSELTAVISLFGAAGDTTNIAARAQAVRQVAEDQDLVSAEFNRAFVLMQYFSYLRRNPNDSQDSDYSGYDFWLTKLNKFNGNYINAEMVKAFLSSSEYRQRFGP